MRLRGLRVSLLFIGLFAFCGALHVLTFHWDLFECTGQWFCGAWLLLWGWSVHFRVTDRRLRRLLWGMVGALMLLLVLQMCMYSLYFWDAAIGRALWYGYYVPMLALPVLLLFVSQAVWLPREQPLPRWCRFVAAAAALLVLSVLTNDLHQLVFRFRTVPFSDKARDNGPLFYVYFAFFGAAAVAAFFTIQHKARAMPVGLRRWVPALVMALLGLWMLLNANGLRPRLAGVTLWNIGECFSFAVTGFLESCIQIGLIPANTGYGRIFSLAKLSAVILDREDRPIYRSAGTVWPFPDREELIVRRQPISGGSLEWAADVSDLLQLNRELGETNRRLRQRNAYLREQGRLKRERAELETRSRLYDRILQTVRPQLEELEVLAGAQGEDFTRQLPRICTLTAYVKRRSNMELAAQNGLLPASELAAALEESVEYLRLCGVSAAVLNYADGSRPAPVVIAAYEHVHAIVSESLDTLSALSITVRGTQELELRLLLQAKSLSWDFGSVPRGGGVQPRIRVAKEDGDLVIVLRFAEGGAAS